MDNRDSIERIILSYLIHDPTLLLNERYPVKAQDFSKKIYRQIYSAALNLYARGNQNIQPEEIVIQIGKSSGLLKEFQEMRGEGILTEINNLRYDLIKKEKLEELGYKVIYIWEKDIKENQKKIIEKIATLLSN